MFDKETLFNYPRCQHSIHDFAWECGLCRRRAATPDLLQFNCEDEYYYLASQHARHPKGQLQAEYETNVAFSTCLASGIPCFPPVLLGQRALCLLSHEAWMKFNSPFMHNAHGLIVLVQPGVEHSRGVAMEIEFFQKEGQPIFWMPDPALPEFFNANY